MLVRFSLFIVLFISSYKLHAADVLYKNILVYNKIIVSNKISKLDSHKLFYPVHLFENKIINKSSQFIRKHQSKSSNFIFVIILLLTIFCSFLRASFINNFNAQFKNFFKFKNREIEEYQFIKKFFFNIFFVLLISYLIFILINLFQNNINLKFRLFYIIVTTISFYFVIKSSIEFIIYKIFSLEMMYKSNQYIKNEMITIFLVIALPILMFQSIAITQFKHTILLFLIVLLVLFYLYSLLKLIFNNMSIIRSNLLNTIIYFTSIEVIPLILLAKFIKINFLH